MAFASLTAADVSGVGRSSVLSILSASKLFSALKDEPVIGLPDLERRKILIVSPLAFVWTVLFSSLLVDTILVVDPLREVTADKNSIISD